MWSVSLFTSACAPELDWRVVSPPGAGVQLMLPCRPSTFAREIRLAGEPVSWTLWSCRAADATWALGYAELGRASSVPAALRDLRPEVAGNADSGSSTRLHWRVAGFTPQDEAGRWRWARQLADGRQIGGEMLTFASATAVYQASVVSSRIDAEAVEFFAASLQPARR